MTVRLSVPQGALFLATCGAAASATALNPALSRGRRLLLAGPQAADTAQQGSLRPAGSDLRRQATRLCPWPPALSPAGAAAPAHGHAENQLVSAGC